MEPVTFFSVCLLGCLIFNSSMAAPTLSAEAQVVSCPIGWRLIQGYCYGYFLKEKNWFAAEAECLKHRGSHLASVHSYGENSMLADYVKQFQKKKRPVWIGLWDPDQNQEWRWADESPFSFSSWDAGQPNNLGGKEHCVVLAHGNGFQKWHDYPCEFTFSFVCKREPYRRQLARTSWLPAPRL